MTNETTDKPGQILIVDDEANIREGLRAVLAKDGHMVQTAATGEEALSRLASFACEAAIVDIRMPGISGIELLAQIKARWPFVAVILLTGHGALETAMTAVKEGAVAYLLKPAQPDKIREAVAQALREARRQRRQADLLDTLRDGLRQLEGLPATPPFGSPPAPGKRPLRINDLTIDPAAHTASRAGHDLSLTPSEFKLLLTLARHAGEAVDYVTLVEEALGYTVAAPEARELIKRHVFTLRQKVEPDGTEPRYIHNVRGVGYRLHKS